VLLLEFGGNRIGKVDANTNVATIYKTLTDSSRPRRDRFDEQDRLFSAQYGGNADGVFDSKTEKVHGVEDSHPVERALSAACSLTTPPTHRHCGSAATTARRSSRSRCSTRMLFSRPLAGAKYVAADFRSAATFCWTSGDGRRYPLRQKLRPRAR
jgi:hypothetical protein